MQGPVGNCTQNTNYPVWFFKVLNNVIRSWLPIDTEVYRLTRGKKVTLKLLYPYFLLFSKAPEIYLVHYDGLLPVFIMLLSYSKFLHNVQTCL